VTFELSEVRNDEQKEVKTVRLSKKEQMTFAPHGRTPCHPHTSPAGFPSVVPVQMTKSKLEHFRTFRDRHQQIDRSVDLYRNTEPHGTNLKEISKMKCDNWPPTIHAKSRDNLRA